MCAAIFNRRDYSPAPPFWTAVNTWRGKRGRMPRKGWGQSPAGRKSVSRRRWRS